MLSITLYIYLRYMLLIQRLVKQTNAEHPMYSQLAAASEATEKAAKVLDHSTKGELALPCSRYP